MHPIHATGASEAKRQAIVSAYRTNSGTSKQTWTSQRSLTAAASTNTAKLRKPADVHVSAAAVHIAASKEAGMEGREVHASSAAQLQSKPSAALEGQYDPSAYEDSSSGVEDELPSKLPAHVNAAVQPEYGEFPLAGKSHRSVHSAVVSPSTESSLDVSLSASASSLQGFSPTASPAAGLSMGCTPFTNSSPQPVPVSGRNSRQQMLQPPWSARSRLALTTQAIDAEPVAEEMKGGDSDDERASEVGEEETAGRSNISFDLDEDEVAQPQQGTHARANHMSQQASGARPMGAVHGGTGQQGAKILPEEAQLQHGGISCEASQASEVLVVQYSADSDEESYASAGMQLHAQTSYGRAQRKAAAMVVSDSWTGACAAELQNACRCRCSVLSEPHVLQAWLRGCAQHGVDAQTHRCTSL